MACPAKGRELDQGETLVAGARPGDSGPGQVPAISQDLVGHVLYRAAGAEYVPREVIIELLSLFTKRLNCSTIASRGMYLEK